MTTHIAEAYPFAMALRIVRCFNAAAFAARAFFSFALYCLLTLSVGQLALARVKTVAPR